MFKINFNFKIYFYISFTFYLNKLILMITEDNFEVEENLEDKYSEQKSVLITKSDQKDNNDKNNESESEFSQSYNEENNINDSLQLYEGQNDKTNNLLGSEEIFINQKIEIEKMKKRNELFSLKRAYNSLNYIKNNNNFNYNNNNINSKSEDFKNLNINHIINKYNLKVKNKEKLKQKNPFNNISNEENNKEDNILEDITFFFK